MNGAPTDDPRAPWAVCITGSIVVSNCQASASSLVRRQYPGSASDAGVCCLRREFTENRCHEIIASLEMANGAARADPRPWLGVDGEHFDGEILRKGNILTLGPFEMRLQHVFADLIVDCRHISMVVLSYDVSQWERGLSLSRLRSLAGSPSSVN